VSYALLRNVYGSTLGRSLTTGYKDKITFGALKFAVRIIEILLRRVNAKESQSLRVEA
jgi:hypothetical protein